MQDQDDKVYHYAKNMLLEIMAVLYVNGRRTMHVGAAMRLMGVDDETASQHDEERIEIEENFGDNPEKFINLFQTYIDYLQDAGYDVYKHNFIHIFGSACLSEI